MFRLFAPFIILFTFANPAIAQTQDSVFDNRQDMQAYIWTTLKARDFAGLVARLGGRDEYTKEQLAGIQNQFQSLYPRPFNSAAQVKEEVMANGFRREVVAYWVGLNYVWLYLFTQERDGKLLVINFRLNSQPNPIFELM